MNRRASAGLWTRDRVAREGRLDPALIQRARTGDVDAFTALVAGRLEPMQRTAMAILGHEADARDAMSDALVAIWRELPRLRDPLAFEAWSTRILVHACRRRLRSRVRTRVREVTMDAAEAGRSMRAAPGPADDAADRLALERAFDRLDADARTILVLHHLDGRGLAEVGTILGIPIGTAKSRLFAARKAFERSLERER
ncbi:MAG: RNA polymerase sigma factor [Candidatus Limnocylindrales bacterium]